MQTEKRERTPKKIYAAMARIQGEVECVPKDAQAQGKGNFSGYKYRRLERIYATLQRLMAKHGVFSTPQVIEQKREQIRDTNWVSTVLTVKYTFWCDDGSHVEAIVVGESLDSSDKGCNKALSAAEKYCLIQCFKLPTEEAIDSESETPEPPAGSQQGSDPQPRQANGAGTHPAGAAARDELPPPPNGDAHAGLRMFRLTLSDTLRRRGLGTEDMRAAVLEFCKQNNAFDIEDLDHATRNRLLQTAQQGKLDEFKNGRRPVYTGAA